MARTPAARACSGVGKGLSPIWSSMTSLPKVLSWRALASTSKAVSAVRERANWLRVGGMAALRGRGGSDGARRQDSKSRRRPPPVWRRAGATRAGRRRQSRPVATGDSAFLDRLTELESPDGALSRVWDREHDAHVARQLLRAVA